MEAEDTKPLTGARTPRPITVGEFVGLLRCAVFYATRGYGRRAWVLFGRPGTHAGAFRRAVHAARGRELRPWRRPPGAL
jgi:hypothetical protein